MRRAPDKFQGKNSQALISTAFQDHITKQLNLEQLLAPKRPPTERNKIHLGKIKSKVDSGLPKSSERKNTTEKTSNDSEPKEFVINQPKWNATAPTLAQKFGLMPIEENRTQLNETEWSKVKVKYRERGDFKQPCVICKEQLGAQQQVLLSCTHTFHRTCLEVFERFSGKKCCPMCRKERYQTRVVYDASRYYKDLCAARIQAAWRGYLVRKWYKNYRRLVPPHNPELRKKFFEEKLSDITNRLVMSFNSSRDEAIAEIERNLAQSRKAFKDFELKFGLDEISETKWAQLFERAQQRDHDECSICMNKFLLPKRLGENGICTERIMITQNFANDEDDDAKRKSVVLLSCSHVFHSVCLSTFEELNFDRAAVCPECRSIYRKKELGDTIF